MTQATHTTKKLHRKELRQPDEFDAILFAEVVADSCGALAETGDT